MLDNNEINQMLAAAAHIRAVNAAQDIVLIAEPENHPWIRRVVCAANLFYNLDCDDVIVVGPRHFDMTMHDQIRARGLVGMDHEQGFIDQHGVFMSRKEAFKVAVAANQLIRPEFQPGVLFSENLY